MRGPIFKLFTLAAALFAAPFAFGQNDAARAQDRIIVLDMTNSMWGPITGGRKHEIAREAISDAAGRLPAQARLGLYMIGNKSGPVCETTSSTIALGPLNRARLDNALDSAKPGRGRMPLFPTLEGAARSLAKADNNGRILVIGDSSGGSCVPKLCDAVKRLHSETGSFAIDAVTMEADAETRNAISCIAEATGGRYANAGSRSEVLAFVRQALGEEVRTATAETPEPPDAAPRQANAVPPLPAANPYRPGQSPAVTLRAILAEGRDPLTQGLAWRVMEAVEGDQDAPVVWRGADPQPSINLPQGRFRVEVTYGTLKATREITLRRRREQTVTINLKAGILKLSGAHVTGGQPVGDIFYYVHALARDSQQSGDLVARASQPQPSFYLPPGRYRVVARHGLAEAEDTVELEAGAILGRNLALNAGTLRVVAKLSEDQPAPKDTVYFVYREDDEGKWQEVARSVLQEPAFTLPAGSYRIEARLDAARASITATVAPGETTQKTLLLPAGRLRLETTLAERSSAAESGVVYRMFRIEDGDAKLVHASARARFEGFLPEGRYRIESAYGVGNAVVEREVTIKAGETRSITFTHEAGRAQLGLVKVKGGLTLGRVAWSIRNSQGEEVFTSTDTVPEPYLRAGQYVAIAERKGRTTRTAFTVSPNKKIVVELVAD
jgi:Ca-activated chloride channel family protein